ncbi:unnamed protein product [marine sediment metagenome]|uniref:Uncharacterized protein n=1 Tax=marine sediment metagenome TaxID=412755 RepID=X1RII8_9ZZZZ
MLISEAEQLKNGICPKCGSQKFYKDGAVVINTNHYKFAALKITCENGHKYRYPPATLAGV